MSPGGLPLSSARGGTRGEAPPSVWRDQRLCSPQLHRREAGLSEPRSARREPQRRPSELVEDFHRNREIAAQAKARNQADLHGLPSKWTARNGNDRHPGGDAVSARDRAHDEHRAADEQRRSALAEAAAQARQERKLLKSKVQDGAPGVMWFDFGSLPSSKGDVAAEGSERPVAVAVDSAQPAQRISPRVAARTGSACGSARGDGPVSARGERGAVARSGQSVEEGRWDGGRKNRSAMVVAGGLVASGGSRPVTADMSPPWTPASAAGPDDGAVCPGAAVSRQAGLEQHGLGDLGEVAEQPALRLPCYSASDATQVAGPEDSGSAGPDTATGQERHGPRASEENGEPATLQPPGWPVPGAQQATLLLPCSSLVDTAQPDLAAAEAGGLDSTMLLQALGGARRIPADEEMWEELARLCASSPCGPPAPGEGCPTTPQAAGRPSSGLEHTCVDDDDTRTETWCVAKALSDEFGSTLAYSLTGSLPTTSTVAASS